MKPQKILASLGFIVGIGAVIGIIFVIFMIFFGWAMGGDFLEIMIEFGVMILFLGWFARRVFRQAIEAWNSDDDFFIDVN